LKINNGGEYQVDLGVLGQVQFSWEFFTGLLSIVLIDLILAGDNAVVIAMAVRSLPRKQRTRGIAFGAAAAVILRVALTFFAAQLLQINFIKFFGGAIIIWIAIKLFVEGAPEENGGREAKTLAQAVWIIIIADLPMSPDNVLAVAGASKGNLFLLIFGLALSIPFVVFTSNLLSKLMDKYPVIIYVGSAVLGRVGGEMMITDPFTVQLLAPSKWVQYGVEIICLVGVVAAGKLWIKMKIAREEKKFGVALENENIPITDDRKE
jgi:YjbE family integral membrane protein